METDRNSLERVIQLWNASRLDLFEIALPDKNFEFHGVIRFYHQDSARDGKYSTKCVRVSSTATTNDVIETLAEKFRSDMRMLSKPNYALYEVHANGEARKLQDNELPLTVQLKWVKDDREGRFLLRNEDDHRPVHVDSGLYDESEDTIKGFKLTRNLTKKERKQKKKKDKALHKSKEDLQQPNIISQEESTAKQLYSEVPESTFTRTVSNPEAVMKKRREQKLQKRGAELLKIYGDSLNKEIPYKTLYLLPSDDTNTVIRDLLDKYGLGKEKSSDYMLVQVVLPPGSQPEECLDGGWGKETILGSQHCPLDISQKWQPHQGTLVFQLRPSTSGYIKQQKKKAEITARDEEVASKKERRPRKSNKATSEQESARKSKYDDHQSSSKQPKLLEIVDNKKILSHTIAPNITEIGSDRRNASYGPFIELQLVPGLLTSHCIITNMDGVVTVTPNDNDGEVYVDGKMIEETTMLSHGSVLLLGRGKHLVFCDPGQNLSSIDIQKRIKAVAPSEQRTQIGSRSRSTASPMDRPRHHSATSSASSKSGSISMARGLLPESRTLQNVPERSNHKEPQRPVSSHQASNKVLQQRSLPPQTATVQPIQQRSPRRLPATLQVIRGVEESMMADILSMHSNTLHFKLSPAYAIYLMQRHFVETNRNNVVPNLNLVTDLLERTIRLNSTSVSELSFWMANISELLNFLRQDLDLSLLTADIQEDFAKTVQFSFRQLVQCMQRTLFELMPAFLSESDEDLPGDNHVVDLKKQNRNSGNPTMYDILHMLSSAMSLLRRCRVNAALTIQLFSQLFHSVNMWLFNSLVTSTSSLCRREWGMRIRARLAMVETWAERQGLELAADCHLARITQATHLLQAPKHTEDDIAAISGTCFKLNSLQLRVLLSNYLPDETEGERRISPQLIEQVVAAAEGSADELTRSDGHDVRLEEDPDLQLPFLLPEDGYSCDVVQGLPSGLTEFLQTLEREGFCTYSIEAASSGNWTVYFQSILHQSRPRHVEAERRKPDIVKIVFNKHGGGMGLSIVAAKGLGQEKQGIYIRSVVKGGAADRDGRLQAGDQVLSVDGRSLLGLDQASAADMMKHTGQTVTLEIAKQGAIYHGLAKLLSQPSPKPQHTLPAQYRSQHARPKSESYASFAQDAPVPPNAHMYDNRPHIAPASVASTLKPSTTQLNGNSANYLRLPSPNDIFTSAPSSMGNLKKQKAVSHTTLAPSSASDRLIDKRDLSRNSQEQKMEPAPHISKSPPLLPTNFSPRVPEAPSPSNKYSLDNPNYDQFPSPPPDLLQEKEPMKPSHVASPSPPAPTVWSHESGSPAPKVDAYSPRAQLTSPKTHDHSSSGKTAEVVRVAPTQSSQPKKSHESGSKSATLPRHFKSVSPWERDDRERKERSIQEQLDALRDEEIDELSARNDLSPLEQDRLKNLLQERDFQVRVREERTKLFSDEDQSEEDYSVPDRPDRERLIQIEGAHALRDAASKLVGEDEDHKRWKEEQRRKKEEAELRAKQEAERREERRRERERSEQERQDGRRRRELRREEEKRRYEEEQRKIREKEEEWRRNYSSLQREEEQQRRKLEEIRRRREAEEKQLLELQKQRDADAREEAEREFLEQKLSAGKPVNFSSSYKRNPPSLETSTKRSISPVSSSSNFHYAPTYESRPVMRENSKTTAPRPVSDGYALNKSNWATENLPPPQMDPPNDPSSVDYGGRRPVSFVSSNTTPKVIGSQEIYNDPRSKREATLKRDQSIKRRGPDPSRLTFKDRQRLFQGGSSSPVSKPKSSRRLLELEESLRGQV